MENADFCIPWAACSLPFYFVERKGFPWTFIDSGNPFLLWGQGGSRASLGSSGGQGLKAKDNTLGLAPATSIQSITQCVLIEKPHEFSKNSDSPRTA